MIVLNCDKVSLSFGAVPILDGISFSLNEGDKLGIIGVNGAGKSTLFSVILGKQEPTSGGVYIGKDKTIGYQAQNADYTSDRTILEEAFHTFSDLLRMEEELEARRREAETARTEEAARSYALLQERFTRDGGYEFRGRCRGVLKNLGLPEALWDKPVNTLSGGQKTRLSLACLLLRDPDVLLLDEPTNHLDIDALFWLESHLKASRKTVLVISHDRYFLDAVAGKILEIERHKGRFFTGNYTAYARQKEIDREIEERHYRNQQKEIQRIEAYIEQQRRWNRERNIIAAESRQKMLDRMEKLDRPEAPPEAVRMRFEKAEESGNDVMTVYRLKKSFPGKPLFEGLSFEVKKRDRLFVIGPNGCGKSTLIKILAGRLAADGGGFSPGAGVRIGYYDQENQDLRPDNTVLDELWNAHPALTQTVLRTTLAQFLFRGDDVEKTVSVLSGGERARLTLAKLMLSKHNLLILDEPTNHLDIPSREILERALTAFDGTLIVVSHDRYLINRLATRLLAFDGGMTPLLWEGTYRDFLDRPKPEAGSAAETPAMTAAKEQYLIAKQAQSEKRRRENQIRRAREEIASLEKRIAEINEEMSDDKIAYDYKKLTDLSEELADGEEKLLSLYETLSEAGEL